VSGSEWRPGRAYGAASGERVVPPYPSRVDLHTHSRRSDGILQPLELVEAAAACGVGHLALTDHDSLAGVRELCARPEPLPLDLLPGVEINSVAAGIEGLAEGELHVLGLGVDPGDERFEAALGSQRQLRGSRFRRIVDRLRELGLPIDRQVEVLMAGPGGVAGASLGRPQVARCLVAAGHASSVDDAMKRLIGRGCPAYAAREGMGPAEAIAAIRAAGGVAVLAHFADAPARRELLRELMEAGLRGLEVHYRGFDASTIDGLAQVARELGLIQTGGSDYHGDDGAYAAAHAQLFVPDDDAATLMAALRSEDVRSSPAPGPAET